MLKADKLKETGTKDAPCFYENLQIFSSLKPRFAPHGQAGVFFLPRRIKR